MIHIDKSKFLNSSGKFYTRSLIYEYLNGSALTPMYTLKREEIEVDGKVLQPLSKLYLECSDPTEYIFANKYFYNYNHWKHMLNIPGYGWDRKAFIDIVEDWREELSQKLRAEAAQSIIKLSKKDSGLTAAKWIADGHLAKIDVPGVRKTSKKNTPKTATPSDNADLKMLKELNVK